ncbi:hypothetical protein L6452_31721 [Arctium lappa]|uniref:Uncharacterized protein n=1 Tax=Arctium lappa TaxID=4217 RepID=A0ACB8Z2S9_ARCLA|nr:hypothetical protein L6452_31721 [Arctium lappa]
MRERNPARVSERVRGPARGVTEDESSVLSEWSEGGGGSEEDWLVEESIIESKNQDQGEIGLEKVQVDKNVEPVEKSRAEVIWQESEAEGHWDAQIPTIGKGTEAAEDGRAVEESMNIRGTIIMYSNPKKQVGGFDANHLDEPANHEARNDRSIGYLGEVFEVGHSLGPERNSFDGLIKVKTVDDGLDHEKSAGPQKEKGPDLEDKLNPKKRGVSMVRSDQFDVAAPESRANSAN